MAVTVVVVAAVAVGDAGTSEEKELFDVVKPKQMLVMMSRSSVMVLTLLVMSSNLVEGRGGRATSILH